MMCKAGWLLWHSVALGWYSRGLAIATIAWRRGLAIRRGLHLLRRGSALGPLALTRHYRKCLLCYLQLRTPGSGGKPLHLAMFDPHVP